MRSDGRYEPIAAPSGANRDHRHLPIDWLLPVVQSWLV